MCGCARKGGGVGDGALAALYDVIGAWNNRPTLLAMMEAWSGDRWARRVSKRA